MIQWAQLVPFTFPARRPLRSEGNCSKQKPDKPLHRFSPAWASSWWPGDNSAAPPTSRPPAPSLSSWLQWGPAHGNTPHFSETRREKGELAWSGTQRNHKGKASSSWQSMVMMMMMMTMTMKEEKKITTTRTWQRKNKTTNTRTWQRKNNHNKDMTKEEQPQQGHDKGRTKQPIQGHDKGRTKQPQHGHDKEGGKWVHLSQSVLIWIFLCLLSYTATC